MTVMDISEKLIIASAKTENWSESHFFQIVSECAAVLPESSIDWDNEAGEEWGRILIGDVVVAILCVRIPFCVFHHSWKTSLISILEKRNLVTVEVQDWDAREFCAQPSIVLQIFKCDSLSNAVDFSQFSLNEFWWATV
jgi:hypothetical protein